MCALSDSTASRSAAACPSLRVLRRVNTRRYGAMRFRLHNDALKSEEASVGWRSTLAELSVNSSVSGCAAGGNIMLCVLDGCKKMWRRESQLSILFCSRTSRASSTDLRYRFSCFSASICHVHGANGLMRHAFNTPRMISEVTMARLKRAQPERVRGVSVFLKEQIKHIIITIILNSR